MIAVATSWISLVVFLFSSLLVLIVYANSRNTFASQPGTMEYRNDAVDNVPGWRNPHKIQSAR